MHARPRSSAPSARPITSAIGRSLDIYYRDTARTTRMDRLNATLIAPGAKVFDIGAHVGDRTGSFLRCGASVVALEPQPHVFRALRLIYGHNPDVTLIAAAAGAVPGQMELHLNLRNPTVATLDAGFVAAAQGAPGWEGQVWERTIPVPVVTLDQLIGQHGKPDFVKLDIEGFEPEALRGLSAPLAAISFEFTTFQRSAAHACIVRLSELAGYEYNFSLGEDHHLHFAQWVGPARMGQFLDALPDTANSGDVFARRV